ncbi:hypothetical protein [Tsukamurella pseudospumae]|uniref:Uncharacterized protein n=1 Tax=Tsukamurella pseudospumae TaxID=239498 RepID=A0A138A0Y1_9ACTN|nr:hypothetical protein [Tsukamurella pseudospumae]KXO88836.1 hypothetical protein AXK61_09270 [Tsukamurella pseudospumae]KXP04080.1 hypothetical protein AXK60_20290 [Tsukamurella pseudospumae]
MLNRQIFEDPPRPLTERQEWDARYEARRAARESRNSLRTARGQYRRYRRKLGATPYLDWARWNAEYDRTYRTSGTRIRPVEGGPPTGVS